jgi:hypothetical protein
VSPNSAFTERDYQFKYGNVAMKRVYLENEQLNNLSTYPEMPREGVAAPRSATSAILPSLAVDLVVIAVTAIAAYLFNQTIGLAEASEALQRTLQAPPHLLITLSILLIPAWYLAIDIINTLGNKLKLPFAGNDKRIQRVLAGRVHLVLLSLYFNAILVALCWSAAAMPIFSKLFLSAVFAVAIFALGKSIPSTKLSFLLSGILFLIVLIATQAFIIFKMQAEEEAAREQLRYELEQPPVEEDED